ncbi:hypothetical protein BT96DRAFT_1005092 [Gymnopus androsaceus JB14]|uniref:Uncharacterized protein n=1 Tax=Gymnopus androsaceus JB14 TaxID=1447944 RepID=A0A6A4GPU4_9AGAR|nr:hypothetical protein BT96DRAFT_1005092 [Gymnopus androsaceus JB14]
MSPNSKIMDPNHSYYGHTSPMYADHFDNILNPPATPTHIKNHFGGGNFEPLTDLPYTVIPVGEELAFSQPQLPLSPIKSPCHPNPSLCNYAKVNLSKDNEASKASTANETRCGRKLRAATWSAKDYIDLAQAMNLDSTDGGVKAIAKVLKGTTDEIKIAALMDAVEDQYDQKQDEDTARGEEIHHALMHTLCKWNEQDNIASDTNNDFENNTKLPISKHKLGESTSATMLDDKNPCKHADDRKAHHGEIAVLLKNADRHGEELTGIMKGFLDLEKACFEADLKK